MTAADAKEWLSRGFWLRQEKEQITRLRNEAFERLTKITQELSSTTVSGTKDPHKYDILAEYDIELSEKEAEIDKLRLDIYNAVSEVKDERSRVLLLARYCECMSWPEIQAIMHYERRWVFALHGRALQHVVPIIEKKTGH